MAAAAAAIVVLLIAIILVLRKRSLRRRQAAILLVQTLRSQMRARQSAAVATAQALLEELLRGPILKSSAWWELMWGPGYRDDQFFRQFRVSRDQFDAIVLRLFGADVFDNEAARGIARLKLGIALRRFSTLSTVSQLASEFGVADGTVINYSNDVVQLLNNLEEDLIMYARAPLAF